MKYLNKTFTLPAAPNSITDEEWNSIFGKTCSKCGERKPKSEFGPDSRRTDGKQCQCRACMRGYHRAPERKEADRQRNAKWAQDNPERHAHNSRDWRASRRARGGGKVTLESWKRKVEARGGKCYLCGGPADLSWWDHVVPLSRGGRHHIDNLEPCCSECNQEKSHRERQPGTECT